MHMSCPVLSCCLGSLSAAPALPPSGSRLPPPAVVSSSCRVVHPRHKFFAIYCPAPAKTVSRQFPFPAPLAALLCIALCCIVLHCIALCCISTLLSSVPPPDTTSLHPGHPCLFPPPPSPAHPTPTKSPCGGRLGQPSFASHPSPRCATMTMETSDFLSERKVQQNTLLP